MRPTALILALRTLALAVLAVLPATLGAASARLDSPAVQELMAMPLGGSAADAMFWSEVLETFGLNNQAEVLREHLLEAHLREVAGAAPGLAATIGEVILSGRELREQRQAKLASQAWTTLLGKKLQVQFAQSPLPLPDEIWAMREALTEAAPGLWVYRHADGRLRGLFLAIGLRNIGTFPMAFGDFELAPPTFRQPSPLQWRCLLPRHAVRKALEAGERANFLCRVKNLSEAPPETLLARAREDLVRVDGWTLASSDFDSTSSRLRLARLLAARTQSRADAFLARNSSCDRLGNCPQRISVDAPPALTRKPDAPDARATPQNDKLALGLKCLAAMLAYWLIVRNFGPRPAAALIFVGGTLYVIPIVHELWTRNWADLWGGIVVIPLSLALLAAPLLLAAFSLAAHRFIHDAHYRREVLVGFAVLMAIVVLETLSERF